MKIKNATRRDIFITDAFSDVEMIKNSFNIDTDLVLTRNFAVKLEIAKIGGLCLYYENLLDNTQAQEINYSVQRFLETWNLDLNGEDLFTYKSVAFGLALRTFIWTEVFNFVQLFYNLSILKDTTHKTIIVFDSASHIIKFLELLGLRYESKRSPFDQNLNHFYFDNDIYNETTQSGPKGRKTAFYFILNNYVRLKNFLEIPLFHGKRYILFQVYHPTVPIIRKLAKYRNIKIITTSILGEKKFSKYKYLVSRYIPIISNKKIYNSASESIMRNYRNNRIHNLPLEDSFDLSTALYDLIDNRISGRISESLRIIESTEKYLRKHRIRLEIQIANTGFYQTVISCVLKKHEIKSYIIQNGLMISKFGDEGKHATFINAYGSSIAENYFHECHNVVCLGDPRMDQYVNTKLRSRKKVRVFTLGIGASGYNPIDLNSYPAIEFEFLYDILVTLKSKNLKDQFELIKIKVRPNGVLLDYQNFVKKYFSSENILIIQNESMEDFLKDVDLYISIYSQTLIEASVSGIPVIYFKKDSEHLHPPFDGNSELVVAKTTSELKSIIHEFIEGSKIFLPFLSFEVLEKYVGPLDGNATSLNLEFITNLLD
jgi:hypothetical protein